MAKRLEIYKCDTCGNIVEVLTGGVGELVCCGAPMKLLDAKRCKRWIQFAGKSAYLLVTVYQHIYDGTAEKSAAAGNEYLLITRHNKPSFEPGRRQSDSG